MCENYNIQYGTNYKCLMPTNSYGPGDNYDLDSCHFFAAIIKKIHLAMINKKKDIQKAIKMLLVLRIADNQKYDDLTTGYMQLGIFQKYKNFTEESMLDPDPVKYLEISKKHKKMRIESRCEN